ncbi:hypothetical protein EJ02DRAFT_351066 [Clathrospora elynae]|uniref:Protein kinase domain-containing protein n=1 Tax=Clathrospora elynae TaxID=706981 RepID=A0A6A5SN41_9PLEO|nr:hypothetical protein EJ02DRAFT_351066 [Clathrospora elynae]
MWDRLSLQKIGSWLKKEEQEPPPSPTKLDKHEESSKENGRPHSSGEHALRGVGLLSRRGSKKRMNSEKRDKLLEVPVQDEQRRAASADRRGSTPTKRNLSPPPISVLSMSAPDFLSLHQNDHQQKPLPETPELAEPTIGGGPDSNIPAGARQVDYGIEESEDYTSASEPPPVEVVDAFSEHGEQHSGSDIDEIQLQEELEAKWILNLSMHFRDMSDREKFFVTFAEEPNKWRRVTVSCDYRRLEPDSLESDLKTLHYQRDKSSRIYEAIRDSLAAIQFYDTVTNLKLETTDGRLHVHVTEDRFRENAVSFDSHISGFVYKVSVNNKTYIKKEIPGPEAVEEFLYEINALNSLQDSKSVIKFEGIIVDEQNELIKGLIISYAEQGALVDMIYDLKPTGQLYWERRERWARQIVQGLSEIHEAGFVQGDFTLSNIVIDNDDNAKIIDINRRGCPVGWEPPELAKLIESGQRISIYIGVKSDIYQLGMVLWALAEQQDEPERQERPLTKTLNRHNTDVPVYFRDIIRACLSEVPRNRPSAANLLRRFPEESQEQEQKLKVASRDSISTHRSDKEYIDPATAVDLEDISQHRRHSRNQSSFEKINIPPTEYPASSGSYILPNNPSERGRSPGPLSISGRNRRSDCSPYPGHRSVRSLDDSELENELASLPSSRETRWEQIYVDGDTKLVQRGCSDMDVHDFASQDTKQICITSPPGELGISFLASKSEDTTPLNLSIPGLQPIESQHLQNSLQEPRDSAHHRGVGNKASFSDRVHQLAQTQTQTQHAVPDPIDTDYYDTRHSNMPDSAILATLEYDVAMDSSVTSTAPPSRGYRKPLHQDSGFGEPERASFESERIRYSLDESIRDLNMSQEEERIAERLWDEKEGTFFGEGVSGKELENRCEPIPIFTVLASPQKPKTHGVMSIAIPIPSVGPTNVVRMAHVQDKALEAKVSNTTIRPASILIPEFHHATPKAVDSGLSIAASTPFPHEQIKPGPKEERDPYYDDYTSSLDDDEEEQRGPASSDLSDYLSHSISFDREDGGFF